MNNEQEKIENWVTAHLKTNFIYYIVGFIFVVVFSLLFYFNINSHSLLYLSALSFLPALVVSLFTYVLLKEYFFLFFVLVIIITPIFIVMVVLFILTGEAPKNGYMLYTNNLTDKCYVKILDYNEGIPWYTSKGCVLSILDKKGEVVENDKDKNAREEAVKKFIKVGGSGKKWSNTCLDLRVTQVNFNREYENILKKDSNFSILNDYDIKSEQYKFIKEISIFRNGVMNTLSDFKRDVPDIRIGNLFTLCEVDPIMVGKDKVFRISSKVK